MQTQEHRRRLLPVSCGYANANRHRMRKDTMATLLSVQNEFGKPAEGAIEARDFVESQ